MTHLMIAIAAYLLLLVLILMFNHGAPRADIDFFKTKATPTGWPFYLPREGAEGRTSWTRPS